MKHPVPLSLQDFWKDTSGQDLVEYALLVGGIALALVTSVAALQDGDSGGCGPAWTPNSRRRVPSRNLLGSVRA